jgi:hypothetical protein
VRTHAHGGRTYGKIVIQRGDGEFHADPEMDLVSLFRSRPFEPVSPGEIERSIEDRVLSATQSGK